MIDGLRKTWYDATTGTGPLKAVLVLGMSVSTSLAMLIAACGISSYEPNLLVPIMAVLSVALVAFPLLCSKFFDSLASKIVNFDWVADKPVKFQPMCVLSIKLITITSTHLPTPYSPPRRAA